MSQRQPHLQWFYRSPNGTIHGPFEQKQMLIWYLKEKLPQTLLISPDPSKGFFPLSEWFTEPSASFMSQPIAPAGYGNRRTTYSSGQPAQPQVQAANFSENSIGHVDSIQHSEAGSLGNLTMRNGEREQGGEGMTEEELPRWYFLDRERAVHGPFSNIEMAKWMSEGYFEESLLIYDSTRPENESGWKMLKDYFPNIEKAFKVRIGAVQEVGPYMGGGKERPENGFSGTQHENRFHFPAYLPAPPNYKGSKKMYPSEEMKPKKTKKRGKPS